LQAVSKLDHFYQSGLTVKATVVYRQGEEPVNWTVFFSGKESVLLDPDLAWAIRKHESRMPTGEPFVRAGFNLGSLKQGLSVASYPASPTFQYNPSFIKDCYSERVQTAHPGGIVVSMGDGSLRSVGPEIDSLVWSRINDPRDGEVVTLD
jgi:hypothetical protein